MTVLQLQDLVTLLFVYKLDFDDDFVTYYFGYALHGSYLLSAATTATTFRAWSSRRQTWTRWATRASRLSLGLSLLNCITHIDIWFTSDSTSTSG